MLAASFADDPVYARCFPAAGDRRCGSSWRSRSAMRFATGMSMSSRQSAGWSAPPPGSRPAPTRGRLRRRLRAAPGLPPPAADRASLDEGAGGVWAPTPTTPSPPSVMSGTWRWLASTPTSRAQGSEAVSWARAWSGPTRPGPALLPRDPERRQRALLTSASGSRSSRRAMCRRPPHASAASARRATRPQRRCRRDSAAARRPPARELARVGVALLPATIRCIFAAIGGRSSCPPSRPGSPWSG